MAEQCEPSSHHRIMATSEQVEHPLAKLVRPLINVILSLAPALIKYASAAHDLYKTVRI